MCFNLQIDFDKLVESAPKDWEILQVKTINTCVLVVLKLVIRCFI